MLRPNRIDPDYSPYSKRQNINSYKRQRQENRKWKCFLQSLSPPPSSPPPSLDSSTFDSDYSPKAEKQYYYSYIKKQLYRDQQIWNHFKLCEEQKKKEAQPTLSSKAKKSARARAFAFGSSDSDYSPDESGSESDICTPQKQKLFSKTDELKILKGLIRANKNADNLARVDDEVAKFINRSLGRQDADFTKTQLRSKIRGMKNKYYKNRGSDNGEVFYSLCAKIWGSNEDEVLINEKNDMKVDDSCEFEDIVVEDSYAEEDVRNDNGSFCGFEDMVVEDSYAEEDVANDDVNGEVVVRKAKIEKELKELEVMTMELMSKRLALMKETADAVMEALIRNR